MLKDQEFLRIPGPTPVPPSVFRASIEPMIGHRDPRMDELLASLVPRLKPLFGTEKGEIFILAGSGTLALETALVNLTRAEDKVLMLVTGAFGERFMKIAEAHGREVIVHHTPWGEAVQPEEVRTYLHDHPDLRAVIATHSETSTGVANPIADIARVVKEHSDAWLIVDAVSSLGGMPVDMDRLGIDAVATSSQKALMTPPGLALVSLGERAAEALETMDAPRFYTDLRRYRESFRSRTVPFTPAVSLLFALNQALHLIEEEGLEAVFARHRLLRDMTRKGVAAMGLPLFVNDDQVSSWTVTAVRPEPTVASAKQIRKTLHEQFGIVFAAGQGKIKDDIFRIGHMGYASPSDVLQYIAALESTLAIIQKKSPEGTGIRAAQEVYHAWHTA
ncbi:MAG: alanine--glyoxylate aminotransferase family protein [Candidatus Carbobacillus altaicus]|uniref:Serine--glyoxylate aminotransferase n=1 Tax=Candidatus Carbonibacillus altaicus TaxID=2163959 RepID=A0A2R6Y143_9BACL|nr:alanine--glyoxylate aminotransferase family protein [Candidatus Carbobacillus altaicus]PTQ56390.1 MAG: Serine--glyoxylate aminotransferase [Candidatus Carbobacillus altaicus]